MPKSYTHRSPYHLIRTNWEIIGTYPDTIVIRVSKRTKDSDYSKCYDIRLDFEDNLLNVKCGSDFNIPVELLLECLKHFVNEASPRPTAAFKPEERGF
jgi:hypothetical protein